ncbi:unnamed protein product [Oikopleura dioica]|uniref:Uncharacterized protein n=1 Tax=Oikopleura dioica TaxID=34765 RepID=E4YA62_OIKDI|nr:unnamed protein product [Oikopleura dioica]CBY33803.1 unnamed protein product [Oikopleura dioica]
MVTQFSDFEIFEKEYYDFADFLALELSDQRRKDRDNKKMRMSRRPLKFPSLSAKRKADFSVLKTKKANGKRIEKESAKFVLY